ncbi:MAG: hypothetical protein F6K10_04990 [Moorea sp. SIO2B7]|nr:hypothetical protein [Moorena sp. SIO2B7]
MSSLEGKSDRATQPGIEEKWGGDRVASAMPNPYPSTRISRHNIQLCPVCSI